MKKTKDKRLAYLQKELSHHLIMQCMKEPYAASKARVDKNTYFSVCMENIEDTLDVIKDFYLTNLCNVLGSIHSSLVGVREEDDFDLKKLKMVAERVDSDIHRVFHDLHMFSCTDEIKNQFLKNMQQGNYDLTRYRSPPEGDEAKAP